VVETNHNLYELDNALTLKEEQAISRMEYSILGGMEYHILIMRS
jgi:hypothetical protein